jgi:hypothetical protein
MPHGSHWLLIGATLGLVVVGCQSNNAKPDGSSPGTGGQDATGGTTSSGGTQGSGGTTNTGGTQGSGGTTSSGGTASTGGAASTGGDPSTGGAIGVGGSANSGGTMAGGGATGAGGANHSGGATGAGGITAAGGTLDSGGAGAGGSLGAGGANGRGGNSGAGGANSTGGTGVSTGAGACPADAFFCSGFEDAALPATATYTSNLPTPVEVVLDSSVHHTGTQSAKVNPGTSYVYRMLSVPAAKAFWFRAYLRTDVPIDQKATVHESFMGANWGQDKGVDIVQEQCEVAVNINDNPVLGSNGQNPPITCPPDGQKIAANTWYCFEGFFDGGAGDLEIFVNGASIIKGTAIAQAKQTFTNFRFGYVEYNGTNRTVWYDDVATGPSRIGCLP